MTGIERIRARFRRVNGRGEAALIPYVVAGYPDMAKTREVLWQCYEAGANLIEVGIPFSDPVADGPTIARASQHALEQGATPAKCLDLIRSLRKEGLDVPILGMTYANLLYAPGYRKVARQWAAAGLDGAIVPDLPAEEARELRSAFTAHGLATTFFAAPSTSDARIQRSLAASTAFLYLVAVYGTTGARASISKDTFELLARVRRLRAARATPLCVGFGVSEPEHVKRLRGAGADGVVVGSALVRKIDQGKTIRHFLKSLKMATVDRRRPSATTVAAQAI
ncbi:MAG TPA: tryptophan synthase subunit alpha [Candidatus Thermoplasmatota archaeon]|nr:tryptophan synthase subunit alpha [Candidatus Thermoplasmatota archaeon]